jgi:probable rRNA maturation factor
MISYNYELDFEIENELIYTSWISNVLASEDKTEGEINYIFCNDEYLLDLNIKHLNHDSLTDIISFDYSLKNEIHGDIYISIERVRENASDFQVSFEEELKRVMIHGILHYCGYKDKTEAEEHVMRSKEDDKIGMFHVKHTD